ncbi:hypothetical protein AB835_09940 [Candidatus Endobugula sertula]|uniref:EamA domain-containing protein n=1 Tax=Candidatus Endobugula sertula TaxID=62101 RepID=A0A1D2QNP4_9GAMM|nr:hypothetical protein AB835_09940 [Candidatus Endobugula sertula]
MWLIDVIPVGIRYMMMSALGFALMGVFVKIAGIQGVPLMEIVAARALISAILSYSDVRRKKVPLFGQRRGLLLLRGLVGSLALMCVYYSLVNLPFAEATVLQYLNPMFTALLALFFLGERLQLATVMCIVFSFLGLLAYSTEDDHRQRLNMIAFSS